MNHNYEIAYVNALTSRLSEDCHDSEIMNKFKGYEGEQLVENLLKQQHQIVFSHNLEFVSSNAVQIDFLIIHNSQISILEVKHYYGDFEIYDNYIKSSYNKRYTSPFVQLYKAKNTLQSILQEINLNLPIHHYLVFSNPTFTLRNHIPNRSQVLLRSEFYKFPNIRNQNKIVSRPPKNRKNLHYKRCIFMNDYQQSILKLVYSGFTTNQIHKMIRYDSELNFLSYRTTFIDFVHKSGLKERTILTMYHKYNDSNIDKIRASLEKRNIQMVFSDEDCYPTLLKEIYDYPLVLFGMGNMSLLQNKQKLAIVGSRKATQYSEQICDAIVPELVKSHITIVSGMAMGADYFAHLKAIEYSGQTIGVAAFGLDYHYPKATQYISELMRKDHLVISEYYPTTKVQKWRFPERNRIISGLSQGVLVTEANERSGSLITIDLALEQNRNVYCCPGTIFQSLSKGGNNRIKEGAKLVQNAQDIIEDYYIFTEQK